MTGRFSRIPVTVALALHLAGSVLAADGSTRSPRAAPMDAHAGTQSTSVVSGKIERTFGQFAGSPNNASNLVAGLRNGSIVVLTEPSRRPGHPTQVTFQPPTRPMGWGNVRTSLALAQTQLAGYGITQPSGQQLAASLNGGPITLTRPDGTTQTVQLQGVLQLRASGMGWGEIAHAYGTKLGPVISGLKSANGSVASHSVVTPPTASAAAPKTSVRTTTASATGATSKGITVASGGLVNASPAARFKTAVPDSAKGHAKGIVSATGSLVGSSAVAGGDAGISTAAGGSGMGGVHGQSKGATANGPRSVGSSMRQAVVTAVW